MGLIVTAMLGVALLAKHHSPTHRPVDDGATLLRLLDIVHPAARTLVDIARAQDAEVGDGTTSVTLLAAEILKEIRPYVEEGVGVHTIIKGLTEGRVLAIKKLGEIAVTIDKSDPA